MKKTKTQKSPSNLKWLLFPLLVIGLYACTKTNTDPIFDLQPNISLVGQSDSSLLEFTDKLVLKISYEDGDGDLGNPDPDVNSIFVKDARLEKADEYYLSPLAPIDARISITGTFNLELSTLFILGNGQTEKTRFRIYVVDRTGNTSNIIETEEVVIVR